MSTVRVRERLTSTSSDVLAGTLLANAGSGRWFIWAVSTVDTATISISTAKTRIADAEYVDEGPADIAIRKNENSPWVIDVPADETQPTIAIGGTTGTVIVEIQKQGK